VRVATAPSADVKVKSASALEGALIAAASWRVTVWLWLAATVNPVGVTEVPVTVEIGVRLVPDT